MTQEIYCQGFGENVRVEFADDWLYTSNMLMVLTVETSEGTFFSVNPDKIVAINWAVKIKDSTVIRLFIEGGHSVDIDPLKEQNRTFFNKVTNWRDDWRKYLSPDHKQQLDALRTPTYPEGGEG